MSRFARNKEVKDGVVVAGNVNRRDDRGDTLIEVLLALFVLGLTALALILAFSTSISASQRHREIATANIVLDSASQQALSQIEQNTSLFGCGYAVQAAAFVGGGVNFTIPPNYGNYTAGISNVEYWNGTSFQATCIAGNVPMEVTVEVTGLGVTYTNTFVVDLPSGDLGIGPDLSNGIPSQLNFGGVAGETSAGASGVAFSPQPVVSVLDSNNEIVQSDLSPIVLSIEGNPANATISGCSANDPDGVATFSGCTITGPAGTYVVHATVLGQGLDSDPSGANLNENSINALGSAFWEASPTWWGTTFTVTVAGAPDKVLFGTAAKPGAPVAGASGATISPNPFLITIDTAAGVVDTTQNGTLTLSLTGGSLMNCAAAGLNTTNGGQSITVPVVAGQVSLTGCQFSGAGFYNATASPAGWDATKYTITASYSNAAPASSQIFVTGPGAVSQLVFITQPSGVSNANPATPWPNSFAVEVEDAFGNPVYTVNLTNTPVSAAWDTTDAVHENGPGCAASSVNDSAIEVFKNCAGSAFAGGLKITAKYSTFSANSAAFSISSDAASLEFTTQPVAGPSGSALTTQPVIEILDGQGNVDTGFSGSITLTSSGGSLTLCTGLTPNNGIVDVGTCQFAGNAGTPYTMTAGLTNGAGTAITATSAQFTPSQAGSATQLQFTTQPVAGAAAGSLMTTQPVIKIEDSQGNVVTSSTATLNPPTSSSGSTLTGCTNLTAVAGVVNMSGCMFGGQVGSYYTMTVSSPGLGSATSELFASNSTAGPASGVQIAATPTEVSVSTVTNVQLTISVVDSEGNPTVAATNTNLTVSSSSTGGFFNAAESASGTVGNNTTVTIPAGSSSVTVYYGDESAGVPTITAYNNATANVFASTTLTIDPDNATQLIYGTSPPSTATAGQMFTVAVWDEDQYGNVDTTDSSTSISLGASNGTSNGGFSCSSGTTQVVNAGVATFTGCSYSSSSANPYTLTASASGLTPVSATTTVNGGAAAKMVIWSGNNQSAKISTAFNNPLSVLVTDASGNPVQGVLVTFTSTSTTKATFFAAANGGTCLSTGGVAVLTCTATTNASGIASSLGFKAGTTAGKFTVTATSTGLSATFNETNTNANGTLVYLTAAQTFTTNSGPIVIQAQDGNGNPVVQSSNLTVNLTYSGFALSTPPATETILAGSSSVSFTVTAGTTATGGTAGITATAAGYGAGTLQNETVKANNGTGTTVTPNSPQTVAAGASVPYPVKITNSTGATLYYKVIAVNGLGQVETASACLTVTHGTFGSVNETVAAPTNQGSGPYTLDFVVESFTINNNCGNGGTNAYYQGSGTLNVTSGAAATIAINGGNSQSTTAGTSFNAPLSAVVTDSGGNPVAGVVVTFTSPNGGAGGTFLAVTPGGTCVAAGTTGAVAVSSCTATTNANGVASTLTFTANSVSGSYVVSATAPGGLTGSPLAFEEQNQ
jgi:type II secretory pathway pseudopilin PulG